VAEDDIKGDILHRKSLLGKQKRNYATKKRRRLVLQRRRVFESHMARSAYDCEYKLKREALFW
jgi:hypothetical protein